MSITNIKLDDNSTLAMIQDKLKQLEEQGPALEELSGMVQDKLESLERGNFDKEEGETSQMHEILERLDNIEQSDESNRKNFNSLIEKIEQENHDLSLIHI